jgi:hypothetical protein
MQLQQIIETYLAIFLSHLSYLSFGDYNFSQEFRSFLDTGHCAHCAQLINWP